MQLVKPFRVIFILLCLITGSALSAFGEARSLDDIKDSGLIRIAVYTDYPPFSFIENDSPTGIDIDIARE
ncbi:MAG: transporter substrate-binding domain-containing protein, partial [Pseudomonadota bacterium]|nr:transporter substrate-binding domain-containing protein [Pseudomonadota bacterium]